MTGRAGLTHDEAYLEIVRSLEGDLAGRAAADEYLAQTGLATPGERLAWAETPVILDERRRAQLEDAATTMGQIMEKAMAAYQRDSSFRKLFGLSDAVEELTLVPSGNHSAVPLSRIDVYLGEKDNDFAITDIVTGGVDGMAQSSELGRAVAQTGAFRAFAAERERAATFDVANDCVLTILHTYGSWANAQEGRNHPTHPTIAVVDVADSPREAESAYIISRLRDLGCYAFASSFDRLRIETVGGRRQLVGDHGPVTCVWLRARADETVAHMGDGVRALLEATRRGLVCTIGGYRSWPCSTRSFLSVLRSAACRRLLSDEENAFVEAHIPETHILSTSSDLSAFYEQERWVLKASDGDTAAGVVVGSDLSRSEWRNRLIKGLKRHDAVQALVPKQTVRVVPGEPEDGADPAAAREMHVKLGLFVFEGRLRGLRASGGEGSASATWQDGLEMGCLTVRS